MLFEVFTTLHCIAVAPRGFDSLLNNSENDPQCLKVSLSKDPYLLLIAMYVN